MTKYSQACHHSVLNCSVQQLTILYLATGYLASQLTILNTIFFSIYIAATRALKVALAIFNTYIGRPTLPQIISYMNHKIYWCNKLFISTSFYSEIAYCHFKYSSACQWGQLTLATQIKCQLYIIMPIAMINFKH